MGVQMDMKKTGLTEPFFFKSSVKMNGWHSFSFFLFSKSRIQNDKNNFIIHRYCFSLCQLSTSVLIGVENEPSAEQWSVCEGED